MNSIEINNYKSQSDLSYANLLKNFFMDIPETEANIIKFARRNTENVYTYAYVYLNRLIHGLMKISHNLFEYELTGWAEWPC